MNEIDQIKERIDIVELIGSMGVNLRKTGNTFLGFCPFHSNTRTPAFTVYPNTQSFYCFGCQASGDAFGFVMRKQGLDFRQALELLAARAGVQLKPPSDEQRQEDARRVRLLEINKAAALYFSYILREMKRGEPARSYVERRGIDASMLDGFQLGYSLDEWSHLFNYLTERKGFKPEEVEAAGLAIRHESRGWYDRFRGRLIFPIRNAKGEIVGYGGRAIGDAQPKYLNTPETLLFKKGEVLYGLDLARDAIRTEDRTVVVEGYMDVITAHQYGFRNVVAPLGTAITRNHVRLLKRLSHNVYLALDADAAGQRATLRGLNALRESAEEDGHMVTTAQGAVRLESDVSLRIIHMPDGRDPDDVIRGDPAGWQALVDAAMPVMEFYLESYTAGLDLTQPQDQRTALDRLLPLLAELDGVQQRVYIARIEQVIGIRAELILDLLGGKTRRPDAGRRSEQRQGRAQPTPAHTAPDPTPTVNVPVARLPVQEEYLLGLALRHVTVAAAVEALLEESFSTFPSMREQFGGGLEDLLGAPIYRAIWVAYQALPLGERPATDEALLAWVTQLEPDLRDPAQRLLERVMQHPDDFRFRQEAERCARMLRSEQARGLGRHLREQLPGIDDADELQQMARLMSDLNSYAESLTRPRRTSTFSDLRDLIDRG